jgi:hypothetical protein
MIRRSAWDEARRLVTAEGASYADAAQACGLALSTLQKRAAQEQWQAQRSSGQSYLDTMRAIKAKLAVTIAGQENPDPQSLFALTRLEASFPEHRYQPQVADPQARRAVVLEVLDSLVTYLGDHAPDVLAAIRPHLAPFASTLEA